MDMIHFIAARLPPFVRSVTSNCPARTATRLPSCPSLWRAITSLLISGWLTVAFAAPGVTVVGIQVDGAAAIAISDFTLRRTGGSNLDRQTLTLKDNLESGVEIIVPARTVITLKSRSEEHTSELQSR